MGRRQLKKKITVYEKFCDGGRGSTSLSVTSESYTNIVFSDRKEFNILRNWGVNPVVVISVNMYLFFN